MDDKIKINPDLNLLGKYFGLNDTVFIDSDFINYIEGQKVEALLSEYQIEGQFDNFAAISKAIRIIDFMGKQKDNLYLGLTPQINERVDLNLFLTNLFKSSRGKLKKDLSFYPTKISFHSKEGLEFTVSQPGNIYDIMSLLNDKYLDFNDFKNKSKSISIRYQRKLLKGIIINLVYYINNHTQYKALENSKPTNVICEIIFELLIISGCIQDYKNRSSNKIQYIRSIIQEKKPTN